MGRMNDGRVRPGRPGGEAGLLVPVLCGAAHSHIAHGGRAARRGKHHQGTKAPSGRNPGTGQGSWIAEVCTFLQAGGGEGGPVGLYPNAGIVPRERARNAKPVGGDADRRRLTHKRGAADPARSRNASKRVHGDTVTRVLRCVARPVDWVDSVGRNAVTRSETPIGWQEVIHGAPRRLRGAITTRPPLARCCARRDGGWAGSGSLAPLRGAEDPNGRLSGGLRYARPTGFQVTSVYPRLAQWEVGRALRGWFGPRREEGFADWKSAMGSLAPARSVLRTFALRAKPFCRPPDRQKSAGWKTAVREQRFRASKLQSSFPRRRRVSCYDLRSLSGSVRAALRSARWPASRR
jgi:hypothetical protein